MKAGGRKITQRGFYLYAHRAEILKDAQELGFTATSSKWKCDLGYFRRVLVPMLDQQAEGKGGSPPAPPAPKAPENFEAAMATVNSTEELGVLLLEGWMSLLRRAEQERLKLVDQLKEQEGVLELHQKEVASLAKEREGWILERQKLMDELNTIRVTKTVTHLKLEDLQNAAMRHIVKDMIKGAAGKE